MSARSVGSPTGLDHVRTLLVRLKLARALEVLDDLVRRLEGGELSALEMLEQLLDEEQTAREGRRLRSASLTARLTRVKTLESFDFSFQPSLDRDRILTLAQLGFVERGEVVHLLGPPGTGKSHLAIALGFEAIKAGKSVFFATLAEIITSLLKAQREGELTARLRFLARPALLIVDEVGYLPLDPGGANLFFQLVNARYEKGAMILTSNRGFRDWGEVFGDNVIAAALLDRLLHHAAVIEIEGSSYRLREHAHLMPDGLQSPDPTPPRRRRGRPPKKESPPSLNG
jgi:DNA replication protein DnaC